MRRLRLRRGCVELRVSPHTFQTETEEDLYLPGSRKRRIEGTGFARVVSPASTFSLGTAFGAISGNTVVTRRVQDCDSLHTELHISKAQRYQWQILLNQAGDLIYSLHCRTSYAADKSASLEPYDVDMTDVAVYLPQS